MTWRRRLWIKWQTSIGPRPPQTWKETLIAIVIVLCPVILGLGIAIDLYLWP